MSDRKFIGRFYVNKKKKDGTVLDKPYLRGFLEIDGKKHELVGFYSDKSESFGMTLDNKIAPKGGGSTSKSNLPF